METERSFDLFELVVALLLGLGAVGGAWAAYQGDLWGGNSATAYGEAANRTTRAAAAYNLGVTQLVRDLSVDVDAKRSVVEGLYAQDEATRERALAVASYPYAQQLSPEAYRVTGLPQRYRSAERRAGQLHIPLDVLGPTLERELAGDKAYVDALLGEGTQGFVAASRSFEEGRRANSAGDRFSFLGVLFSVGLFLAGVSLVFKSKVRWAFALMSWLTLMASTIFTFLLPWA